MTPRVKIQLATAEHADVTRLNMMTFMLTAPVSDMFHVHEAGARYSDTIRPNTYVIM